MKIEGVRRSFTVPAGRIDERGLTEERGPSTATHDISKDYLIFNSARNRMNVFKKFKSSHEKSSTEMKFKRKVTLAKGNEGGETMNETVQSLDQLKKLDNDFAKRLKDAHFVISKDEYFSSSYADVIKG